jgi:hypothetical protein
VRVKSLQPFISTKIGMIGISFLFATFSAPICTAAVAQNNDSGMDQVFNESSGKKSNAKSDTATESDENKSSEGEGSGRRSRILSAPHLRRKPQSPPLTSLEAFARSPIVQGTAWPGVGPFKPGEDNNLVDPQNASMRIDATDQKQVTGVDLALSGRAARDFLTVEMASDFLLEALGTKPARIADFNTALEKNRPAIFNKRSVASFNAGRYKIRLLPNIDDPQRLVVQVQNMEAIPEAAAGTVKNSSTKSGGLSLESIFNVLKPVPEGSDDRNTKPDKRHDNDNTQIASATPASGNLKDQMRSLIENWQKVKCTAVKKHDTKQLNTVLTGKALGVQTKGVEWLATHHQYIEMVPKNVTVSKVEQVEKNKKYTVLATVKQSSKTYDEQSNQLLKETEDTLNVVYTVEKQGDNYFISDSAIEKMATPQDGAKK